MAAVNVNTAAHYTTSAGSTDTVTFTVPQRGILVTNNDASTPLTLVIAGASGVTPTALANDTIVVRPGSWKRIPWPVQFTTVVTFAAAAIAVDIEGFPV